MDKQEGPSNLANTGQDGFEKFPASENDPSVMLGLSQSWFLQHCKMRFWVIAQVTNCLRHTLLTLEAA